MKHPFPPGFLWGASTSGYQIEGGNRADGKGASIWDRFTAQPGNILHGDTGAVACNTYDRRQLEADLDSMARLGLDLYIFSAQWPRLQPRGQGRLNAKGLDYYRHLAEGLAERGIAAGLTLYHWELPQALQEQGGWRERDTALRFADYAGALHAALAPSVPIWITQNEPHTSTWLGHVEGTHAPGLHDEALALPVAHHLLLSHGLAVQAIRAGDAAARPSLCGPVLSVIPCHPADRTSAADRRASARHDGEQNRLFLEPIFKGRYPPDVLRRLSRRAGGDRFIRDGDLDLIATPVDFLGVNYYAPHTVAAGAHGKPDVLPAEGPQSAMGWAIDPPGLQQVLRRLQREYTGTVPLLISENGISCRDYVGPDGRCVDSERVDFLRDHLLQAKRALDEGVPLVGYCVWSLLDNFEWDSGYRERFGLIHVDYATQVRTPKASFDWYARVIAGNGLP